MKLIAAGDQNRARGRVRVRLFIDALLASKNKTVTNVILPSHGGDFTEEQTRLAPLCKPNATGVHLNKHSPMLNPNVRPTLEYALMLHEDEQINRLQSDQKAQILFLRPAVCFISLVTHTLLFYCIHVKPIQSMMMSVILVTSLLPLASGSWFKMRPKIKQVGKQQAGDTPDPLVHGGVGIDPDDHAIVYGGDPLVRGACIPPFQTMTMAAVPFCAFRISRRKKERLHLSALTLLMHRCIETRHC